MKALGVRGITADVATTDDDGDRKRLDLSHDDCARLDGQCVRYFPRQSLAYTVSYPLERWLRRNVRNYDLVHTHGLFSFPPVIAAWCAKRAGIPCVMAPHGVLDSWGIKNKSTLIKSTSIRLVEGPLLRAAAAVHFMSELEASRAGELGISLRPAVLPLGFEFDTASDEAPPPGEGAGIRGGKPTILYLSRIHPVKRLDVLLRAFAGMRERQTVELAIAGDGEPSLVASLKRLSSELGLEGQVRWLGFAAGGLKRWLFSHATVFVLPSASENFGVAIVEAMHAGVPVVVTRGAGLAKLVDTTRAGLVTDESVEGLRSALEQLLADAELRQSMAEAGRRAAAQEFSLEAFGARLENLYRSVLADSRRCMTVAPTGLP